MLLVLVKIARRQVLRRLIVAGSSIFNMETVFSSSHKKTEIVSNGVTEIHNSSTSESDLVMDLTHFFYLKIFKTIR